MSIETEIRRIVDERLREQRIFRQRQIYDPDKSPAIAKHPIPHSAWEEVLRLQEKLEEAEREYCQEMKRANDRINELEQALSQAGA